MGGRGLPTQKVTKPNTSLVMAVLIVVHVSKLSLFVVIPFGSDRILWCGYLLLTLVGQKCRFMFRSDGICLEEAIREKEACRMVAAGFASKYFEAGLSFPAHL